MSSIPDGSSPASTERWTREWSLYRRARELPVGERASFLAAECRSDATLLADVEELLRADAQSSPLLDGRWAQLIAGDGTAVPPAVRADDARLEGSLLAGRYQIVRGLAAGGMGRVYEAFDQALQTRIAVKLINPALGTDPAVRERFRREVNLARRISHPHVCRIHDLVEDESHLFLTMELLEGESLAARLRRDVLPETEVSTIASHVASALDAAHRAGVVHRDLKPANIMLVPGEEGRTRAVVTDFGLATARMGTDQERALTGSGQVLGTLAYMSPEQLEGKPATAASDLYAFGLIVHEMLTGKHPWRSETPVSMALERLRSRPALAVPRVAKARWEALIERCLERNPSKRYASAAELLRGLSGEDIPRRPRTRWLAAAAAVAILAVLAVFLAPRGTRKHAPGEMARRSVLVTHFENRSGDPLLDGTIEYLLERELTSSPLFEVVSRERIQDALGLMQKPRETVIDTTVAREITMRDGNIQLIASGRIQRLGDHFLVQAALGEPGGTRTIAAASYEMRTTEELPAAVRAIVGELRSRLGEDSASIRASDLRLERVTTPSLQAVQLYSRADALIAYQDDAAAAELLRAAISADPSFASAHIHLAWALRNLNRAEAEYLPFAERALELSSRTTDRERLFIRGSWFQLLGRLEEAAASYKALLQIDPSHNWAVNNLLMIHGYYGHRYAEAVPFAIQRARLRPNDVFANSGAAWALAVWQADPRSASAFFERARGLAASGDLSTASPRFQTRLQWLELYPLHARWMRNEIPEVLEQLRAHRSRITSLPPAARNAAAEATGRLFLAMGRLREAQETFEIVSDARWREGLMLDLAMVRGNEAEIDSLLRHRASVPHRTPTLTAAYLARAGRTALARATLDALEETTPRIDRVRIEPFVRLARGEIALREQRLDEAISLLDPATRTLRPTGADAFFLASQSLARAWVEKGDPGRATAVLQDALQQRERSSVGSQARWLAVGFDLLSLYEMTGRTAEAASLRTELQAVTAFADADYPLRAERFREAARSESLSR